MPVLRIHQLGCIISLVFALAPMAEAKDLSVLQSAVTYAREDMEKAKAEQEANALAVTQQQRIVDERKKQLAAETRLLEKAQKDTQLSRAKHLDAQKKYEKSRSTLDEAWGKK
jgi:hypothetical protein